MASMEHTDPALPAAQVTRSYKLDRKEKHFILGVAGLALTLITTLTIVLFYVMTPRQVHDADVAKVEQKLAVDDALSKQAEKYDAERNQTINRRLGRLGKAMEAIGKNQAVLMSEETDIPKWRIKKMPEGLAEGSE